MDGVSVVIPAYNREKYIGEAIESVLAQAVENIEIIVVDNNSTDGTATVARSYPKVQVLEEPRQGIAFAMNTGVNAATGYWLAFLDSDDLWMPDKLTAQLAALQNQPANIVALGLSQNFLDPHTSPEELPDQKIETRPVPGYHVSALLMRAETFQMIGSFDESLFKGIVVEWFTRLMDAGLKPVMLNQVVHRRRIHAANIARDRSAADYMAIITKTLRRRRAQSDE